MKKYVSILLCSLFIFVTEVYAFNNSSFLNKNSTSYNPLLDKNFYDNIDFSKIKPQHYAQAIYQAEKQLMEEYINIADNEEEPTFENTIVALDRSGLMLFRIQNLYSFLQLFNDTVLQQSLQQQHIVQLEGLDQTQDESDIYMRLFERVEAVYNKKEVLNETDQRLVEAIYNTLDPRIMNLSSDEQDELYEIDLELEELKKIFNINLFIQDDNDRIFISEKEKSRLYGVVKDAIASFENEAKRHNKKGYLITYQNPKTKDILLYCKDRSLRKQVYEMLVNHGKERNSKLVIDIMNLKLEKAKLLGYNNYAEYALKDGSMVKTPQEVISFLDQIKEPTLKKSKQKYETLLKFVREFEVDPTFELKPWDISYYETQRSIDWDQVLKPYFELSNVRDGVFTVLNKLYGVSFNRKEDASLYYKNKQNGIDSVEAFEVIDEDGKYLGLLYLDYFTRVGKAEGSITSIIRPKELKQDNSYSSAVVGVCTDFSSHPTEGKILLSSFDVLTLFHEMGHAINLFLMQPKYNKLSVMEVDIGELPSQLLEKWAFHKEVLPLYAKHYKTGEVIPYSLIEKINQKKDKSFTLSYSLFLDVLDLSWNMIETKFSTKGLSNDDYIKLVIDFENKEWEKYGYLPEYVLFDRTYNISHMMDLGYESRLYNYLWSEMLVEGVFDQFKEKGIFNREVATKFRTHILSIGNHKNPLKAYQEVSGKKDLDVKPLLRKYGIIE